MKKLNKKGFTLAELLIVVAIIAVLVAIAIPIFTTQLEKSREATDIANIRNAYAEAVIVALNADDGTGSADSVAMVQTVEGWDELDEDTTMAGVALADLPAVTKGNIVTVSVDADGEVQVTVKG